MLNVKIMVILLVAFLSIFSQDEIADADTSEILDVNLENFENFEIIEDENKKLSWYFSLSPRVGVDNVKKQYADFLKRRADSLRVLVRRESDGGSRFYRDTWYQPASASGVSFCFETGISTKINAKSAVTVGVGYSFSHMRSVFGIEDWRDSLQVLKISSLLVNNSVWFSTNFKTGFDSSYFNVKGIDVAGFYAGGAFVLSRYFERDTINSQVEKFNESRRKNYDGLGASGRVGLFAQKKIGRSSLFEYSIGYLFLVTSGYEDFWNRNYYWENAKKSGEFLTISNALELSFSLIF